MEERNLVSEDPSPRDDLAHGIRRLDWADPGCDSESGSVEDPACQDGIDNDSDSWADFPADPGCQSAAASTESPYCDDGIDNDGDGWVDLQDPVCVSASHHTEFRCGLGFELVFVLPPLMRLRTRRRRH